MRDLLYTRPTLIWLLLMAATSLSWILAAMSVSGHALTTPAHGGVAMLLVVFFKVRLVVMYFMEARSAPAVLRWTAEAAVALIGALVVVFYLHGARLVDAGFPVG